jgi:hypothetical protein
VADGPRMGRGAGPGRRAREVGYRVGRVGKRAEQVGVGWSIGPGERDGDCFLLFLFYLFLLFRYRYIFIYI